MEILVLKIIVLCCLFVTCLTASLLPLKFVSIAINREGSDNRRHVVERVLRFLNCFGGGVFLATCLLDLLPDVQHKLTAVLDIMGIQTNFPVAEFITVIGLFLILSVEQIAYDCKETSGRKTAAADVSADHRKREQHQVHETVPVSETSPLLKQVHPSLIQNDPSCIGYDSNEEEHHTDPSYGHVHSHEHSNVQSLGHAHGHGHGHGHSHGHSHGTLEGASTQALIQHTESHDMVTSSSLRSLVLLLALSLHSLFEGLALGLQVDLDQLLGIFAAITIHKTILALSLGINFVQSNLRKRSVIQSSVCFSVMAPLGIVIGILVMESLDSNAHNIISGVLQGLATGTFLYITFFEVLPMEMSQPEDRLLKVLFTIFGFAIIVGTMFLDPTIMSK